MEFKAALFDLDGVVTDSASIHFDAWEEMFDNFLKDYYSFNNKTFKPFEKGDYLSYVDGKPRLKGIESFLKSREILLPQGKPSGISMKTIHGLGNIKNKIYLKKIKKEKPKVYESTITLIKRLKRLKIKIGLFSSSKNAKLILKLVGLIDLFEVIVDGNVAQRANLKGKPSPETLIYASKKLKVNPDDCVIFEDAVSGVQAGTLGNFGMVVGISRKGTKLKEADLVVKDLEEFSLKSIKDWFRKGIKEDSWKFKHHHFDSEKEKLREALTVVGNGYLGTRGCFETQTDSGDHYPGFYIAGIYNIIKKKIKKKSAINNSLVNCPNWLLIKIQIGKEIIDPFKCKILDYEKILNIKEGTLDHKLIFRDYKGRTTKLESKRLTSMHNPHICAINFSLQPLDYSEEISLISSIDGSIENNNVDRYKELGTKHLKTISKKKINQGILLHTKTKSSHYHIVISARNIFNKKSNKKIETSKECISEKISFKAKKGEKYSLEKLVSVFTSLESENPINDSTKLLNQLKNFKQILIPHKNAWKRLWNTADIYLEGDRFSQLALRFHIYHLLSTYSPHVRKLDVGVPVRGLHGEAYRGHVFWDDIYILPFFNHKFPEISKASLMYRYRRLKAAKENAKKMGYKGAMYPWQSADTGFEETQTIHYNPIDGKWGPDFSMNQRHVSLAIFYVFYKYLDHTRDQEFINEYGAEVMVEIARFWTSIAKFSNKDKKYHIHGVMGPDEFHEKYPLKRRYGLRDNAYTNIMTSWALKKTIEIVKTLPNQVRDRLRITEREIRKWDEIRKNLNVIVKNGIIIQFENFDKLKEVNWQHYMKKYGDIRRMDRILKSENKSPNSYKLLKQADTLMIFYLLDFKEAIEVLRGLGIKIKNPRSFIDRNFHHYLPITTHGSTLSRFVHGSISVDLNHKKQHILNLFKRSLSYDIYDLAGGSTHEGIHCGLMAGTINMVEKYFAGVRTTSKEMSIKPWFPEDWKKLSFKLTDKGKLYELNYENKKNKLVIKLKSKGKTFTVKDSKVIDFKSP